MPPEFVIKVESKEQSAESKEVRHPAHLSLIVADQSSPLPGPAKSYDFVAGSARGELNTFFTIVIPAQAGNRVFKITSVHCRAIFSKNSVQSHNSRHTSARAPRNWQIPWVVPGRDPVPRRENKKHVGYFLLAQNSDHSQPMPVQLNTQLARRTRIISCLFFAVWRAIHAGANKTMTTNAIEIAYFAIIKIWCVVIIFVQINGGANAPPYSHFAQIIYHTLPICPVLLLCATTGCILPCGRCATWNRSLSGPRWSPRPGRQSWCLRFRHCGAK